MIKLKDVLCFPQSTDPASPVQIVMPEDSWDDFTELYSDSRLLDAVIDWEIESLSAEKSTKNGWESVLRIALIEPK